jgi:3-isopropylmalate/(R)-2-methylmalate dehydratase small subunit
MTPEEMAAHALEDLDPRFASGVKPGDVVAAGQNFGSGSSREQAAACLKAAGVQAVVAKSFARIYFRNAINIGLPVLQSPEAVDALETGDPIDLDLARGEIRSAKGTFRFHPLPESVLGIIAAGGLIEYTKAKLAQDETEEKKE